MRSQRYGRKGLAVLLAAGTVVACTPVSVASPALYADGVLPVGDGKYVTDAPRAGSVYMCSDFAASLGRTGIGGAKQRGPWFTPDGTGYRPADKPHVRGEVTVPGQFAVRVVGGTREISTNGLPQIHPVGSFPVAADDPVRAIDPNPNTIAERKVLYELPVSPTAAPKPGCIRQQVGVMLRSAALLSPVDAEGRDAVAWEVQDRCDGHPEPSGQYHFHGPSQCLPGTETPQVIGYALDGFPITGSRDIRGREVFSRDLDQCHGGFAAYVDTDGRTVSGYRYSLTRDWPYSVSCFTGGSERSISPGSRPNPSGPASGTAGDTGFTLPVGDHDHG